MIIIFLKVIPHANFLWYLWPFPAFNLQLEHVCINIDKQHPFYSLWQPLSSYLIYLMFETTVATPNKNGAV